MLVTILSFIYITLVVSVPLVLMFVCLRDHEPRPDRAGLVNLLRLRGRTQRQRELSPADYQVMVELHTIRRRFDLALFKLELKRKAAEARRNLRAELHELDQRERL